MFIFFQPPVVNSIWYTNIMARISFYGGAQEISGSCYLIESDPSTVLTNSSQVGSGQEQLGSGIKILVDCGLFQCQRFCEPQNYEPFPFNPSEIEAVFVTHAHMDHIGRIPKLYKEGFEGNVYSTPPTKELAGLMLEDSLHIMEREAEEHKTEMIYKKEHVEEALKHWQVKEYHEEIFAGDARIRFLDAGHILGSAMVEIILKNRKGEAKKIVVTGDVGNPPSPLLMPTEKISDANVLVIEATYGNRIHEERGERKIKLERAIEDTVNRGGVLMIPAFSIERSQELLYEIDNLIEQGRVPKVPVYLDSPLAIRATEIYRKYEKYFNKETRWTAAAGGALFKFPTLTLSFTTEESKAINDVPPPKIVIAGSGMSTGGRILHHERRYLSDPKSTLLLVSFQAAGTMGRQIQDGAKEVDIFGEPVPIRAHIERITGYSAHPDYDMLMQFVRHSVDSLDQVFAIHGEPEASLFFVQRVRDYLGIEACAPRRGGSFEI